MKNKYVMNTHYLSISYKVIINNVIFHYFLFILDIYLLLLQIMEIFINNFVSYRSNTIISYTPFTKIILFINKFPIGVKLIIYIIIIIFLEINYQRLNSYKFKTNTCIAILINISELLFYRLLSLFMFNYLFSFSGIFLLITFIISLPYILALLFHFKNNHLFIFFPRIINYPYDSFSMIVDLHLLPIKIFLSISGMTYNKNISKFFFFLSLVSLYVLTFYLTYIMLCKSYYLMNNCALNKVRYSSVLSLCCIILFIIIIGRNDLQSFYSLFCYANILIICTLFICYFYDPYEFSKFDKDDNQENVLYYFFILDRNKNNYLLLEQIIEKHLSICNKCNLCKKYNTIKLDYKKDEIDLYYIIFNGKNFTLNLMNNIIRGIRKNGKKSFIYNSYYLINVIYIYTLNLNQLDYNSILNTELMFEVINSENEQILDEHKVCLERIKYTNNFFIKAKNILDFFYEIFDEKKLEKKTDKFFKLGELLEDLKYKEIKSNINNNINNNGYSNEGLPNCNNLLTICTLFYEELYNEPISNSGVYIRETPNILEDLINNNLKYSRQITLEINIQHFQAKIIRAGGQMNKYENNNLIDLFPVIFKSVQIKQMKDILLYSNNNLQNKINNQNNNSTKKGKKNQKQYINFNFIIEEKEGIEIFYRKIKLKLSLIFLMDIETIIYLNGIYTIDKEIIVTEQKKDEEIILHFGSNELKNIAKNKKKNSITIKNNRNEKYFGNKKLIKDCNCFIKCKNYNVYHFLSSNKKNLYDKNSGKNTNRFQTNDLPDDKSNIIDNSNKLIIFNDLASQASSTTSSLSKNNFINYNRGNKQTKSDEDINKDFKLAKYILLISILIFLITIILEYFCLRIKHIELTKKNNFLLALKDYTNTFHSVFFSILSLSCIGNYSESGSCLQYIDIISRTKMKYYVEESFVENETISQSEFISDYINDGDETYFYFSFLSFFFVDFSELLFKQAKILSNKLEYILGDLIEYLSNFNGNEFIQSFSQNITHYQIHQNNSNENNLIFSAKKENIVFTDFILLITSRCGILTKDMKDFQNSIYFLNVGGNDIFKNVYNKNRLNSFQENYYLLLLDNEAFFGQIYYAIQQIEDHIFLLQRSFNSVIYIFLNINFIFIVLILVIIFGYIYMYFIIIFKILQNIYYNLNQKLGANLVKDLMRKKIDNLKLILSFYENDLNATINDLNNIYTDYTDSYNLKIKEDSKQIKKEGRNETNSKIKKYNIFNFFKIANKFKLFKSSGRKSIYLYGLLFIIIISIILYIIVLILWIYFFKKDNSVHEWDSIAEEVINASNRMMSSFLIMIFRNQTINELSNGFENKEFLFFIYNKLSKLYNAKKYLGTMGDLLITTEKTMKYDCQEFFQTLKNDVFFELEKLYEKEKEKFYFTIWYFCEVSNIMIFKNYKTIYLQLFNKVKNVIENFKNKKYSDIIDFYNQNEVVAIEVIFLIVYSYLLSLMFNNTQHCIIVILEIMHKNVIISGVIFLSMIGFLILNIILIYVRNVNKDTKQFIHIRKVFKICNINE